MPANDRPLVTIVLPTYNRARLLPYAIHSVIDQTYDHWELIVVDDNSSDATGDVVATFSDPRIRYLRNETNHKLPRSLNRGFTQSQGDFLTWTSDDNLYARDALEKMVNRLESVDCDLVYADYFMFSKLDEHGRPLDPKRDHLPDQIQLEKGNHIGACFLYSRKLYQEIGNYDPDLFLVEDYDYFIRASKRFIFHHIPEALYYFRRDDNTLYLSRFTEVKASDFLVRYKNGLIDERQLLELMIMMLTSHMETLKNPWLRLCYQLVSSKSYRLAQAHKKTTSFYLRRCLQYPVYEILTSYRQNKASFSQTRDRLKELLESQGSLKPLGH